ncbi:hypothetical protein ACP275_12G031000 [Erythranthe tilingii]
MSLKFAPISHMVSMFTKNTFDPLSPKRYKYSEIKKITKSFNENLGQGGYGNVYKGVLSDGTLVAVKVFIEADSDGEEFINEVTSISKTSHVNIFNLLGFCFDRNKRALVYEFMPNKSLDKFISNNCLDLEKLYNIAVEVAKGLEYLHTGCNTRIRHYRNIAPEVFSRNFGRVSHKSDVYSYGMMVLEMAGAKKIGGTDETCGKSFSCGDTISGIGYPFRGFDDPPHCGHRKNNITNIEIMGVEYRVLEIAQSTQTMTIAREDIMEESCPTEMKNTTLDYSTFDFGAVYLNITFLYGCPPPPAGGNLVKDSNSSVPCGNNGEDVYITPGTNGPGMCRDSVVVPAPVPPEGATHLPNITELDRIMRQGFLVRWKIGSQLMCDNCTASKGRCGYNLAKNQTACYCPVPPYVSNTCPISEIIGTPPRLPNGNDTSSPTKIPILPLALGVVLGVIALTILAIILVFCYFKRRRSLGNPKQVRDEDMENVYKGVLPDGTLVAVKVLIETDSNGEEFINEVASISRTSHVNIVNLLGFCYNRNKRAIVYEFMPNKSLDKFLINSNGSVDNTNYPLDMDKLYKIAVGVAKGLEYLHTGCNTSIVHFDIKPQNILLDEDFSPKISDFGLAKLFKKKQSILSMLGTRGTIGYIAPEIFSRNFGRASHKSDVYSYGMMVLEMAGARKFDEIETTDQMSDNYFPDKMYEQVILDAKIKLGDLVIKEEEETSRKMFLIGFWCIQTSPSDRPSMSKVVEMLEGSLRSIQIPPKPFLFSPSISGNGLSSSLSPYVGLEHSIDGAI